MTRSNGRGGGNVPLHESVSSSYSTRSSSSVQLSSSARRPSRPSASWPSCPAHAGARVEQLDRRRHRHGLDLRALRHRRVGGAVGHVRTVAAVENAHRLAAVGMLAERLQFLRRLARAAHRLLRLRQQLLRALERDRVDVVGLFERAEFRCRASRTDRSGRGWPGSASPSSPTPSSRGSDSSLQRDVERDGLFGVVAAERRAARLHRRDLPASRRAARRRRSGRASRRRAGRVAGSTPSDFGPCALALSSAIAFSSVRSAGARSSGSDARGPPSV